MNKSFISSGTDKQHVGQDQLPQNAALPQNRSDYKTPDWQLPNDPKEQLPEDHIQPEEEDFRVFIKARSPRLKAPESLLQRIKHSIEHNRV